MHILQRREAGQDDVGMAAGFVEVNVQTEHERQRAQRLGNARPLGRGEHRVGAYANQGLDLARAGRFNFFGQTGDGKFAKHFRRLRYAAVAPAGNHAAPLARRAAGIDRKGRRFGKHGATFTVQVACKDIEHIDQPTIHRAKALGASAYAAIDHGALGLRQFACKLALACRSDAAGGCHAFGAEVAHGRTQGIEARKVGLQVAQSQQIFCKQGMHQTEQKEGIASGLDRQVQVRLRCCFGAARVDHHDAPAALAHRARFASVIGHGP